MRSGVLITLFLCAPVAFGEGEPRLESSRGEWLELVALPPILDDEQVAPQLLKGLTTSFVFRLEIPGVRGGSVGAARVEIRYELWDEVFEVHEIGVDGRPERLTIDSEEALRDWWRALRLTILDGSYRGVASDKARVILEIIPFSHAEETDTQRWFAETVRRAELSKEGTSVAITKKKGSSGGVLDLLIATSIRRRPLKAFRWEVALPNGAPP